LFFRSGHDVLQHASPTQFFYEILCHRFNIISKAAAKVLLFFEICKFYSDFLKFAAVWGLSPGERKKKKKRTKRINKKRKPDPSTTVGGSIARMRVGDAAKAAWRSVGLYFLEDFLGCLSDFVR